MRVTMKSRRASRSVLPRFVEVSEVIEASAEDACEFACGSPADLNDVMTAFAAYWRIPSRPRLGHAWEGAGTYRLRVLADTPADEGEPFSTDGFSMAVSRVG